MQERNDSVSCIQRREVICKCATIVYLVYNDARLYASTQNKFHFYINLILIFHLIISFNDLILFNNLILIYYLIYIFLARLVPSSFL